MIVVAALWNLTLKIVGSIVFSRDFDTTEYEMFQAVFGMVFTAIVALESKRSLLVVAERRESIAQARTVIPLALLAIVRRLDAVYWMVRDQDYKHRASAPAESLTRNTPARRSRR